MASHTFRGRLVLGLALSVAALAPWSAARAQSLSGGMNELEDAWRKHRSTAQQLLRGMTAAEPGDKSHVAALDMEARYLTYRVYLDHLEVREEKQTRPTLEKAFRDFDADLGYLEKGKPGTQAAADIFRDKVRLHAKEVIDFEKAKPVHKLFNARILAEIAKLGQGQLADTLVEVLKDEKQNDGVRYYALRGLRNLLALVQPMQMPPIVTKDQETKCAEALIDFLEKKEGPTKGASREEIDGFRVLRREAVRALAQIHSPSLGEKARPALVLARFAGADERIQPEPRIDERVEAAIGLARMQSTQDKQYQPDYAANQIGRSLGAFGQKFNDEKAKKEGGGDPSRPWKIDAYRFNEALNALKTDSGKDAYVAGVVDRGARILGAVMRGDQPNADDLNWFTTPESDAPNKELFKGVTDSVVKPGKPAEAPAEK
jgi:hypothetical protein